ncbi:MAG: DUF1073 domain-containing protein [Symploca sp. SIO2G7]|nr:DUF1073 domain-containing protein [Symploca sp. SIO2G7]
MVEFFGGTYRNDSEALGIIFAALSNNMTGVGTARDKSQYAHINIDVRELTYEELTNLPRKSRLIRRAIHLFPNDAVKAWYKLKFGEDVGVDPQSVQQYLRGVRGNYRKAFRRAAALGRQYGDAFILLNIVDGRAPDEPVDETRIRSIRSLKVARRDELYPDYYGRWRGDTTDPEHYRLNLIGNDGSKDTWGSRWHRDRVLRFSGDQILDNDAITENGGYNDSIIQAMFNAWVSWEQGLAASSAMLQDYDQFTIGIKGLSRIIKGDITSPKELEALGLDDNADQITKQRVAIEHLYRRGLMLDRGRSVVRGLMYDLENEEPGSIQRRYQGADKIMDRLEDVWAASTGIPKFKLYNLIGSTGISTGVQAATILKFEWASQVNDWADENLREPLERLCKYAMLARNSPTGGYLPKGWEVELPLALKLSPMEQVELQKKVAERDSKNIPLGIYTAEEARRQYETAEFDYNLVLEPRDTRNTTAQLSSGDEDSDEEVDATDDGNAHNGSDRNGKSTERGDEMRFDVITKRGNKWVVLSEKGKLLGEHDTPEDAVKQLRAIEAAKHRNDDATPVQRVIDWQGFKVGLQYLPFQYRYGRLLPAAYGHFQKTKGADGMALDVYVGTKLKSPKVYAISQQINGEFDEEKMVIGVASQDEAIQIFIEAMPPEFFGGIREMSLDELRGYRIDAADGILSDLEWERLSQISAADFVSVAEGILETEVSPAELQGKTLVELKAIAAERGLGEPTRYRNRKAAWIELIQPE